MGLFSSLSRWLGLLIFAAGLLVFVPPAHAGDEIRVCVVAILATDQNTKVDSKLQCIAKEIQKKEPSLTGFRLSTVNCKALALGAKENFCLVEGEVAALSLQQGMDKDERVQLTVKAPTVGEITYTTTCGKYFPLVTSYQTKDKERLIIAIMVRTPACKGK